MADTKLSALTELAAAPAGTDQVYLNDGGVSKRLTITNLFTSPTLVTPALGTPASGVLTNCTGTNLPIGKHTIWIPAAAMRPTASNGCAALADTETTAGRPDITHLAFDTAADEHAQFQLAFPKMWNLGTITFQAFWTGLAAGAGGVAWGLQGVSTANDDTMDVAYGTAVVVTDTFLLAEDMHVTAESGAVTIAGTPADDDECFFRVFRDVSDAADTRASDCNLLGIKLFFTTDAGTDA